MLPKRSGIVVKVFAKCCVTCSPTHPLGGGKSESMKKEEWYIRQALCVGFLLGLAFCTWVLMFVRFLESSNQ